MKIAFCTISALNYCAQVHVLAQSFQRHAPDEVLHWLVVDRKSCPLPEMPPNVRVWWAEDLGVEDFEKLAYCYDVIEFNTLLKPDFLLKLLAERCGDHVAYLDPDTALFSSLRWLEEAHEGADAVVTPHALLPPDTDEASLFLRNGVFNFGFASFASTPAAIGFLRWWRKMCYEAGFNDAASGLFVDQKWANYLPIFVPRTKILLEPGTNAAFWNLHERTVTQADGRYQVNGRDLHFFHFSGLAFDKQGRAAPKKELARFVAVSPALAALVDEYCAAASAVRQRVSLVDYSFDFHTNGVALNSVARRVYVYSENRFESTSPFRPESNWYQFAVKSGLITRRTGAAGVPVPPAKRVEDNMAIWLRARRFWRLVPRVVGVERYARVLGFLRVLSASRNQGKIWAERCPPLGVPIKLTLAKNPAEGLPD
jgi:hypothetical protein